MVREATTSEEQRAIDQWLKTNKPTICPPKTRSDPDTIKRKSWGRKKKKSDE